MNRADHVTGGTVLIVKGFMAGTLNRSANILNPLGRVGLLPVMKTSAQRAYLTPDSLSGSPEAWATLPHPAPTSVSRTQAGPAQLIITGPAAVTRQRRDKLLQSHLICAGFCLSSRTQSCTRPKTALLDVSPASVSSPPRHLPFALLLPSELLNDALPLVCLSKFCKTVPMLAGRILSKGIDVLFVQGAWLSVCKEALLTAFV